MAAARAMAAVVLRPAAEATDQADDVPPSHLRALAEAGLYGVQCPGHGVSAAAAREVFEVLAGACGATFFLWVQHHAPVRLLAASPNGELAGRWLPRLCSGEVYGGVAYAHLRRPGPPAVVASPRPGGGWSLTGEAPWATGWGSVGAMAVAARAGERVLFVMVEAGESAYLRPSAPLRLLAMTATRTVSLTLRELEVGPEDVICDVAFEDWLAQDRVMTARPNPAVFGVAAAATGLLADRDRGAARALEQERLDCRGQAEAADPADIDRLVGLRAWSLDIAQRAAHALVVATGGRAMALDHPAQRLVREVTFYAIVAQTGPLRRAVLDRLTRGP